MSKLWNSSRQCLSGGSLLSQRDSLFRPSPTCTRFRPRFPSRQTRRPLLTLAIETSCDDTCVAILEKNSAGAARLHFNEKITSDNRAFRGVHPLIAVASHSEHLAPLVQKALRALPRATGAVFTQQASDGKSLLVDGHLRVRPDFVSVTRGPGMTSNLSTGLSMAKGLATAWDVPLLAVNHMQAHALTPQLVGALQDKTVDKAGDSASEQTGIGGLQSPQFPFLSLLVSGGHTMLVRSNSLSNHSILANSRNIAVGDMLDKCARLILPQEILSAQGSDPSMYGPIFEEFAFPGSRDSGYYYKYTPPASRSDEIKPFDPGHGWTLTPPLALMGKGEVARATYEFAGLNGQIQRLIQEQPDMHVDMRRILARATMTLAFEHLTGRLLFALGGNGKATNNQHRTEVEGQSKIKTVVLSGGVASNMFLRHVVRKMLDARGYADVEVVAPPVSLCTDNAAMIAWTGMEMYENGWRSDFNVLPLRKWPIDPNADGGGILDAPGWYKAPATKL